MFPIESASLTPSISDLRLYLPVSVCLGLSVCLFLSVCLSVHHSLSLSLYPHSSVSTVSPLFLSDCRHYLCTQKLARQSSNKSPTSGLKSEQAQSHSNVWKFVLEVCSESPLGKTLQGSWGGRRYQLGQLWGSRCSLSSQRRSSPNASLAVFWCNQRWTEFPRLISDEISGIFS